MFQLIPQYEVIVHHSGPDGDFALLWEVNEPDLEPFLRILVKNRLSEVTIRNREFALQRLQALAQCKSCHGSGKADEGNPVDEGICGRCGGTGDEPSE